MQNDRLDSAGLAKLGLKLRDLVKRTGELWGGIVKASERAVFFLLPLILTVLSCFFARRFYLGGPTFFGTLFIIVFACSLIVFLGWFLYLVHPYFRRWHVRVLCGCGLFVWGFATFFYFPVDTADADDFTARILRATNRTSMTMFAKGRAYGKPLSLLARVNYGAFQTALLFYVAAVLFSVFGRTAMNCCRKWFVWKDDMLHVFWGLTERDRLLARSIHSANIDAWIEFNLPKSVMYDTQEWARLTDLADELGALWTFVKLPLPLSADTLPSSMLKGEHHYFLGDDGHANMAMAERLAGIIIRNKSVVGKWHFFVRAGDIDNEGLFMSWSEGLYEKTAHMVEVMIIREAELVARDFVSRHPPISASCLRLNPEDATVDGDCRTLLLGFDRVGRELLNVNLCISGFVRPDGRSIAQFPFTVVDMKKERWERYLLSAPEIASRISEYGLSFEPMQVGMGKFESWFRQNYASFDRIIFCMSDDAVNIRECLRVSDILKEKFNRRRIDLFVRIENPHLANLLSRDEASNDNVHIKTFGDFGRLYSYSQFHADEIDQLAAAINWRWNLLSRNVASDIIQSIGEGKPLRKDLRDDILRYWWGAGVYNRRSSVILSLRCLTFCRIWGIELRRMRLNDNEKERLALVLTNGTQRISYEEFRQKIAIECHRHVLARMEHHRWSTYMRVCGYRSFDDAPEELRKLQNEGPVVLNQIKESRRHAGLVAFDPNCEEQVRRCEMGWRVLADSAAVSELCGPPDVGAMNGGMDLTDAQVDDGEEQDLSKYRDIQLLRECAGFADIYPHASKKCDGVNSQPAVEFLESDEIHKFKTMPSEVGKCDVFWFEDVISRHYGWGRKRKFKTRFAFVYEHDSGMIRPLGLYSKDFQAKVVDDLRVDDRLVDFKTQPHFVARVTREKVTCDGKKRQVIVVSFCGTECLSDWVENVMQCMGFTPPQFRLAASLLKAVCETCRTENVYAVGHSEGGGEVQYSLIRNAAWRWCGAEREIRGFTFNSQRLCPLILQEFEYKTIARKISRMIDNLRIEGDIVSGSRELGARLIGTVVIILNAKKIEWPLIPGASYAPRHWSVYRRFRELIRSHSLQRIIADLDDTIRIEKPKVNAHEEF